MLDPDRRPSFLYVEDDPASREIIRVLLTRIVKTSTFFIFEDSTNFRQRVDALPVIPDVALLDIQMEPLDGYEMLSILRSEPRFITTRMVAMTASVMTSEIARLKDAGFDGLIGKPIAHKMFMGKIRQILAGEQVWTVM